MKILPTNLRYRSF